MRCASVLPAAVIVLISNAFVLVHVWKNRAGPVETDITLTERELPRDYIPNGEDSVMLNLRWMDPPWTAYGYAYNSGGSGERPQFVGLWLDQKTLQELGFDTSIAPSDKKAFEFYQRQRPSVRSAFVALEYEGPAWRKHLEQADRESLEHAGLSQSNMQPHSDESDTHLVAVDAATDAERLRKRHPDRNSVIIVPGLAVEWFLPPDYRLPRPALLSGLVQAIPASIHVPRPFSDAFRRLPGDLRNAKYRVHLRYGTSFEPWIVGVEFPPPS